MAEDAQKTWIQEANRLLRENPELTKKEVETLLSKQGKDKPTGIESRGSRSFKKKTRSTGQRQRRKAQEQVSTEAASEYTKTQRRLMQEDLGIAEYAGLEKPSFEHKYSQDVSGLLEEGAPGDYVARFPESESALKTEAERVSRQNFGNKFAIVNTATDLKAVPVEAFSELVDPEDLPGFRIDPDIPLKEQFSAATQVNFKGGAVRTLTRILPGQLDDIILGGFVSAGVGGAALFGGATPTQAAEAAGATFVDIATDPGGMQGSGAGERFYPDGMERQSPEGLARAQREREEAFQKSVVQPFNRVVVQPFNQVMNFVGGVVKMIPAGVGF